MKDFREVAETPYEIAVYAPMDTGLGVLILNVPRSTFDEHGIPLREGQMRERPYTGLVRISEPQTIKFKAVANDEIAGHAVEALNAEERKLIEELNQKIAAIREKKAQLFALGHEKAS